MFGQIAQVNHATVTSLEEILKEAPLEGRSDTTIWRVVNDAGAKARQILGARSLPPLKAWFDKVPEYVYNRCIRQGGSCPKRSVELTPKP
jgi:hypothetical protein